MEFLANILSGVATTSTENFTLWLFMDEPECPDELI